MNDALRAAITRLVHNRDVELDAYTGPIYFMMHGVRNEERARELAAHSSTSPHTPQSA
ncbi:hypothetical protein ACWDBW_38855 [Streptomyces sp. NPDC001107]